METEIEISNGLEIKWHKDIMVIKWHKDIMVYW